MLIVTRYYKNIEELRYGRWNMYVCVYVYKYKDSNL